MNEPSLGDLFATEPFDDAFSQFVCIPWVTGGNLQAPQIKVDLPIS